MKRLKSLSVEPRLQSKDLGLAMSAAQQRGVPTPLGLVATDIYKALGENPEVGMGSSSYRLSLADPFWHRST